MVLQKRKNAEETMYSSFPPQEGNDPKLSSIMATRPSAAAAPPSSAAVASRPNNLPPHPPQVGKDPKLLACCMNDNGDSAITSSSSSSQANLGVAAAAAASSVPSHQQVVEHDDAAPPSKESIANSLLSFKQTSPTMATKAPPNSGIMANFCQVKPNNPADSLTNVNQLHTENHSVIDSRNGASNYEIHEETDSHSSMLTKKVVFPTFINPAAEPCINNSNFWLQEEEERFL
jgi:hypothetical protein